jgi:alpha-tubulin suppressor-like RCC1 family protein
MPRGPARVSCGLSGGPRADSIARPTSDALLRSEIASEGSVFMRRSHFFSIGVIVFLLSSAACGGDGFVDSGSGASGAGSSGGAGGQAGLGGSGGGQPAGGGGASAGGQAAGAAGTTGGASAAGAGSTAGAAGQPAHTGGAGGGSSGSGGAAGAASTGGAGSGPAGAGGVGPTECKPGDFTCKGNDLYGCSVAEQVFIKLETCPAGLCMAGQSECNACFPGATIGCADAVSLQLCSPTGAAKEKQPCPSETPYCSEGKCVLCSKDEQCPPQADNPCVLPVCLGGECTFKPGPMMALPPTLQQPHNCLKRVCDGAGQKVEVLDETDVPEDDGNDCTIEACNGGQSNNLGAPVGTPCGPEKTGFCSQTQTCGVCNPGTARCNNGLQETCSASASWVSKACEANSACSDGACELITDVVAGGEHTCARIGAGRVACWGSNEFGQLGLGTSGPGKFENRPKLIPNLSNVSRIALGNRHTCALQSTGTVLCWGDNSLGQLGLGDFQGNIASPQPVPGLENIEQISLGIDASCALSQDQSRYCWGDRSKNLVGDGMMFGPPSTSPVLASGPSSGAYLTLGGTFGCVRSSGQSYVSCWGANDLLQATSSPGWSVFSPTNYPELLGANFLALGKEHGCAEMQAGNIRCWGRNDAGQLGAGVTSPKEKPVATLFKPKGIFLSLGDRHTCELVDGQVVCAGDNADGQLGTGSIGVNSSIPVPVVLQGSPPFNLLTEPTGLTAGGAHTCATTHTGVYCWGKGTKGQLGNGATISQGGAVPVLW